MQPVVSFGRVFFGLWNKFFLCALPGSPRPPCTMQKYPFAVPQGRVFAGCKAAERTARGNRALPCFSSCPTGLRLNISRLSFLTAISLKLWLKSYLWKSEI